MSFQEIILLLTFIGSCIYATVSLTIYRFSYNKSSCISPTKQKEPLTWVEVSGKTKALTQSGNHYEKSLTFP